MYDTIIRYNGSGFHTKVISKKKGFELSVTEYESEGWAILGTKK